MIVFCNKNETSLKNWLQKKQSKKKKKQQEDICAKKISGMQGSKI